MTPTTKEIVIHSERYGPQSIFVDTGDFDLVSQHTWHVCKICKRFYAMTNVGGKRRSLLMHNLILPLPKGKQTDHRDLNGLNNTRANLRIATPGQNQMNKAMRVDNKTGAVGVRFHKKSGKYRAEIWSDRTYHYLGSFVTMQEAVLVRDAAARRFHGEFARLNSEAV